MERERLFRHPAIALLKRAIRREKRLQLLAALLLLGAGIWLCYQGFYTRSLLSVIGLFIFVLGLKYTFQMARRQKTDESRLMQVLRHHPEQIVWVYTLVTQRLPFGFQLFPSGTLYFKLVDGDEITVGLPARHLKLVSRILNRLLPHASFGYTPKREQWYKTDPRRLMRNNGT